jgi:hypothetical protein
VRPARNYSSLRSLLRRRSVLIAGIAVAVAAAAVATGLTVGGSTQNSGASAQAWPNAPMSSSFLTPSGSWAILPMGHLGDPGNTFWELFFRPGGRTDWTLVTPPGVADNGGLSAAADPDGSVAVVFAPNDLLTFSPFATTSDNGKTWSAGVIPFGTAPLPDVLTAPAGAIAQYSALGRSGLKIEAGTGAEPEWSTLYTSNGLAASAAGRSCGAGSLTALAGSGVGELVGSDCRTPGVVGIFAGAGTPGSLELVGPTLVPSDGQFSVLRLSSQKSRVVALVDGRNGSVNDLYALSGDGQPSSWSVSRSFSFPAGGAVVSSGFGPDGSLVVETRSASGLLQGAVTATGSGGSWTRLPQLPAGTEGVSVAADGTVDALSADLSELTVWQLTVGRWIRSQVVIVPIQYGSSS